MDGTPYLPFAVAPEWIVWVAYGVPIIATALIFLLVLHYGGLLFQRSKTQ